MPQEILYEFDQFQLSPLRRKLRLNGEVVRITPLASDLLSVLVKNNNQSLSKTELINAVWSEAIVTDNNFNVTLNAVRRALGESGRAPKYILKVTGGYCFVANVCEVSVQVEQESVQPTAETKRPPNIEETPPQQVPAPHIAHTILSCCLYGALYGVALVLEIAYEFDRYGQAALKIAPAVFVWIAISSIFGLTADRKLTSRGAKGGLLVSALVFLMAAAILFFGVSRFLPVSAITQLNFRSYPAQAAYLKDMSYFLVLASGFLILPFHITVAIQREVKFRREVMIYVRPWMLTVLLVVLAGFWLVLTSRLMDNLKPGPYTNLFAQLVYLRALLYFGLGVECVIWYSGTVNEIQREGFASKPE